MFCRLWVYQRIFMQWYSWNSTKIGIKHKSINQRIFTILVLLAYIVELRTGWVKSKTIKLA